ncbi:MAG: hypothetical protein GY868_17720, partial [Deltaproteobacteria bacterium]|nr:hypothetical protein [Deltaproteobacteria bacterium]
MTAMTKITDLPDFDRPREKLRERGPEALSDTELIAVILGSGIKGKHVLRVADAVVKKIDRHYRQLDVKMLTAIEGIGFAKACQIVASVEFARRRLLRD